MEGTCCSYHKICVVAYGVKNYHVYLDLDPSVVCNYQIRMLGDKAKVSLACIVLRSPPNLSFINFRQQGVMQGVAGIYIVDK